MAASDPERRYHSLLAQQAVLKTNSGSKPVGSRTLAAATPFNRTVVPLEKTCDRVTLFAPSCVSHTDSRQVSFPTIIPAA